MLTWDCICEPNMLLGQRQNHAAGMKVVEKQPISLKQQSKKTKRNETEFPLCAFFPSQCPEEL